jgi:crotonobetainyl-CoA:carnitine CoA-transferase CaiB-like acyl-CoA transferase
MTHRVAQAYSGMMSINRGPDGTPHKIQTTIIDAITGLYAYQTVSMALFGGVREARHLDVSLMQAAAAIMGPKVMEFAHFGHSPASPNAPAGSYRTSDGWIAITLVRESNFADLAGALGRPELAEDDRFRTFALRLEHLDALLAIMQPILESRTTAEWVGTLTAANVLASPIHDFGMWLDEHHVQETLGAPVMEVLAGTEAPVPRTPGRVPYEVPCAQTGADTARILAEFGMKAG